MPKRKLLLADDSPTIQKVVSLAFAAEEIEILSAGDAEAAMEKLLRNVPDLVMANVNTAGFDGYAFCEIIKRNERTKHVPVILLVGSFESFDEEKARRVGANDYITKPFQSIRQLVTKVTGLLDATDKFSSEQKAEETDSSKTQSLSVEDLNEINFGGDKPEPNDAAAVGAFAPEKSLGYQSLQASERSAEQNFPEQSRVNSLIIESDKQSKSPSGTFTPIELDEINLLELPFANSDEFDALKSVGKAESTENERGEQVASAVSRTESSAPFNTADAEMTAATAKNQLSIENVSAELIDAIAAKVIEKLSDKR